MNHNKTIKKLYERGYRCREISEMLNISKNNVKGIIRRKRYVVKKRPTYLTDKEKAVIVGTMLGDAYITKEWANSRIGWKHCSKQKEYAKWKASLLENLSGSFSNTKSKCRNKIFDGIQFRSKCNSSLNKFHKAFYQEKKIIPQICFKYYNELSLAIHFMDDGAKNGTSVILSTNCFSEKDIDLFNTLCRKKFNIEWVRYKSGIIYLPAKYYEKFKSIVLPFMHETMLYKLPS